MMEQKKALHSGKSLLAAGIKKVVGRFNKGDHIKILDNKKKDQLFQNFDNQIKALQWHSYEVSELNNSDVTILGSSDITKFQIFKYKNHAYGIQFHMEVDENTIIKWSKVPELKNALKKIFRQKLH